MRSIRLDEWSVMLWQEARRRTVLRWLAGLPLLGLLGVLGMLPAEGEAKHPVQRVQDRRERHRKKRRRNQTKKQDRGHGPRGGVDCTPQRPLSQTCQRDCQCPSGARCDAPRPDTGRGACGQDALARRVCCLADGEACATICDCCGDSDCFNGVCQKTCASGIGEGEICATYTYEDVGGATIPLPVRCCGGVCPPNPTCRPAGAYCPECDDNRRETFQACCTSRTIGSCPSAPDAATSRCTCITSSSCASDKDCGFAREQCRCGRCCLPDGATFSIKGRDCDTCCSGLCDYVGNNWTCLPR